MLIVLVTFNIILVHFFDEERLNITASHLGLLFSVFWLFVWTKLYSFGV